MRASRTHLSVGNLATAMVSALVLFAIAQATEKPAHHKVHVKNFGCVNEQYYRGAQPEKCDYEDLAERLRF